MSCYATATNDHSPNRETNNCVKAWTTLFTVMLLIFMAMPAGVDAVEPLDVASDDLGWRSVLRCGPNSLYVLLAMHGKRPDYDALVAEMRIGYRGASAADLVRVAKLYGLALDAVQAEASALPKLPLPAISHFLNPGDSKGHYVLLLSCNRDDTFTIIECTRGTIERLAKGDFLDRWSGVILAESTHWHDRYVDTLLWVSSGIVIVLLTPACWTKWRKPKVRSETKV
jgi:Peptidase C39 family